MKIPEPFNSLDNNSNTIPSLLDVLTTGGVTPFVGAGMSVDFGFPQWRDFLLSLAPNEPARKRIAARLKKGEYEEAADYILHTRGSNVLQLAITRKFAPVDLVVSRTTAAINQLPALCSGPVLTTNFDCVLERVFEAAQKPMGTIIGMKLDLLRDAFNQRQNVVVKLHGDARDRTDRVFTLTDYRARYGSTNPLEAMLDVVMKKNPFLFLGCSLNSDRPVRALRKVAAQLRRRKAEALLQHYAVLEYPSTPVKFSNRQRELERMCVQPIWYPTGKHVEIGELLTFLVKEVTALKHGILTFPHLFRHMTAGIEASRGFTAVEQFLALYLGQPGGHEPPLVGRAEQVKQLDHWLESPDSSYALIAEPAGRGKSALVTRWANGVAQSNRAQVIFVPISLRFDTASPLHALEVLGNRLRFVRSDYSPAPADAQGWARSIEEELRAPCKTGPLLVVLDGVDEANGWEVGRDLLFPPRPSDWVKVLVTARLLSERDRSGWLRQLRWDDRTHLVDLPPLVRKDLREAVRVWKPAPPEDVRDPAVTDKLLKLTGGDPLLVKLYLDGLAQRVIRKDTLSEIAPGLEGYFQAWWDEQRRLWGTSDPHNEPAFVKTLSALCIAQGPIAQQELIGVLAPETGPQHVEQALRALDRFVIQVSYGRYQAGYTFSHPEFRRFFHQRYITSDQDWHDRFARRGSQLFENLKRRGKLQSKTTQKQRQPILEPLEAVPENFSPYFLRHYGRHLECAGASIDRLAALVSTTWLNAWRVSENTEWNFLADAERLSNVARSLNARESTESGRAPHLHHEVKCLLVRASLISVSRGTPPELLKALLDKSVWDTRRALADARQAPVPLQRVLSLAIIAQYVSADESRDLLDEASAIGRGLEPAERSNALKGVCLASIAVGDIQRASASQHEVADRNWRKELLIAHIPRFVRELDAESLMTAVEGLEGKAAANVLLAMMGHVGDELKHTLAAQAKLTADHLNEYERAVALLRLARSEPEQAPGLIDEALALAARVAEWGMASKYCPKILAELPAFLTPDQINRAWAVADCMEQRGSRGSLAMAELVRFEPEHRQHQARRRVLARLLEKGVREPSSRQLLCNWVGDIYVEEMADLLGSFRKDPIWNAPVILALADRISDAVFADALREIIIAVLGHDSGRDYWWQQMAPYIPERRWPDVLALLHHVAEDDTLLLTKSEAISAEGVLRDPMTAADKRNRLCGLLKIAASRISAESVETAVAFARATRSLEERCATLAAFIPRLAGTAQLDVVRDVLAAANELWLNDELKHQVLTSLPAGLPVDLQKAAVHLAANQFRDRRAAAIASLAPKLDKQLLNDLIGAARAIEDKFGRERCMTALGPLATPRTAAECVTTLVQEGNYRDAVPLIPSISEEDIPRLLAFREKAIDPHSYAAYIATFAPRLDRVLIREAIQKLQGVSFDWRELRERLFLSPLALRSVELGLVSEALDAIEHWKEEEGKSHALITISRVLPPDNFERAERIAHEMTLWSFKAQALCGIARLAPDPPVLRTQLLQQAGKNWSVFLMVLATDWRDDWRTESLWDTVTKNWSDFNPSDCERLDRALELCAPAQRDEMTSRLLEHCESRPQEEIYRDQELWRVVARHCSDRATLRLAALAKRLTNVHEWVRVVEPLFERFPALRGTLRSTVAFKSGYTPRTEIITDVIAARYGTDAERRQVIDTSMSMLGQNDVWLLQYLASLLVLEPTHECYRHAADIMAEATERGRCELLDAIVELVPVIRRLQSRQDISNIINAISEVSKWWP